MKIGEVIRKYRKAKDLTQEEMANWLGVTAPAVNKWENSNTMPDITLLVPIARLLGISLDELLSYQEELNKEEIRAIMEEAEIRFSENTYETAFDWAKKQIQQYSNCEELVLNLAMMLEGHHVMQEIGQDQEYESFVLTCYERLLKSTDEAIRMVAADALYRYYLRNEEYKKAEEYLAFLSIQNPERKRKQAALYEKAGDIAKAYQTYEEILFAEYQILFNIFNSLCIMALHDENMEKAKYLTDKKKALIRLFEMGEYNIYSADLELAQFQQDKDKTIECVNGMLKNFDSVYAFSNAQLYSHMTFKKVDQTFIKSMKDNLFNGLYSDENFQYMKGDSRWEELAGNN